MDNKLRDILLGTVFALFIITIVILGVTFKEVRSLKKEVSDIKGALDHLKTTGSLPDDDEAPSPTAEEDDPEGQAGTEDAANPGPG